MSGDGNLPSSPIQPSAPADDTANEGRRYWKAAIAHLAPEKREAAWEFYLDRLESSAAADTLGGVMLLLEAHLAFFDDFPARLGLVAQQIEAALQTPGQQNPGGGLPPSAAKQNLVSVPPRRWRTFLVACASAVFGAMAFGIIFPVWQRRGAPAQTDVPAWAGHFLFSRANSIKAEPWTDPRTHRQQGVVVSFGSVAWTERTASGGANVYVLSPVEEVRRDLQALSQPSR